MLKKLSLLFLTSVFLFTSVGTVFAHEVKQGDTMYRIAVNHEMSLQELGKLNPQVRNLNLIFVGQTIKTNSNDAQTVSKVVSKPVTKSTTETTRVSSNATTNEQDLLARLVRAEAESEPYEGKVAVAKVVLNRVASSQFPNSISAVINQKGQFSPVTNGTINRSADRESIRAVKEALNTSKYSNALFFYNSATASSRWLDSRPTVFVIGHHTFKR